ncbi:MAG: hypothetical protein ACFFDN_13980 [Candidatus Hodarchaeota archaeon]
MPVDQVRNQIKQIQHLMSEVMHEDEHYGKIPGCGDKPTLFKPGAEKLCFMFRLSPSYQIERLDLSDDHREYIITCILTHASTGIVWGQGVGSAVTTESKYKYRWDNTEQPVPKDYWKHRDRELLGGEQYAPRKTPDGWMIFEKIEHDNPADYYNTVLKIGKKRALVDAILTCTAASDIFEQDIEDMIEAGVEIEKTTKKENIEPPKRKAKKQEAKPKERVMLNMKELEALDYQIQTFFGDPEAAAHFVSQATDGVARSVKELKTIDQVQLILDKAKEINLAVQKNLL